MRKVYIYGHLKKDGKETTIDWEGYLDGAFFYPDKNNVRMFYKVVKCHVGWTQGIYAKHIEDLDE